MARREINLKINTTADASEITKIVDALESLDSVIRSINNSKRLANMGIPIEKLDEKLKSVTSQFTELHKELKGINRILGMSDDRMSDLADAAKNLRDVQNAAAKEAREQEKHEAIMHREKIKNIREEERLEESRVAAAEKAANIKKKAADAAAKAAEAELRANTKAARSIEDLGDAEEEREKLLTKLMQSSNVAIANNDKYAASQAEVRKEVKATNSILDTMESYIQRSLGTGLKSGTRNVESLATNLRLLRGETSSLDRVMQRSKTFPEDIRRAYDQYSSALDEARLAKSALNKVLQNPSRTIEDIEGAVNAQKRANAAFKEAQKGVDRLNKDYDAMGATVNNLENRLSSIRAIIKNNPEIEDFIDTKALKNLETAIDALDSGREMMDAFGKETAQTMKELNRGMGTVKGLNTQFENGTEALTKFMGVLKQDRSAFWNQLGKAGPALSRMSRAITQQQNEMIALNRVTDRTTDALDRFGKVQRNLGKAIGFDKDALRYQKYFETQYGDAVGDAKSSAKSIEQREINLLQQQNNLLDERNNLLARAQQLRQYRGSLPQDSEEYAKATNELRQYSQALAANRTATTSNRTALTQTTTALAQANAAVNKIEQGWSRYRAVMQGMKSGLSLNVLKDVWSIDPFKAMQLSIQRLIQDVMRLARAMGGALRSAMGDIITLGSRIGRSVGSAFSSMQRHIQGATTAMTRFGSASERALERTAAGWGLMMSGQGMVQTSQMMSRYVEQAFGGFLDFEKSATLAAVSGSSNKTQVDPREVMDMVFGAQRGSYGTPLKSLSSQEVAQGIYYYTSAIGQEITPETSGEIMKTLMPILQVAGFTQTSPETMVKSVINTVSEFGIDPRNLAMNGDIMAQVADSYGFLANATTMEVPDIAEFFKMVGPLAGILSPQDPTAAITETMGWAWLASDYGLRGSQPGRGLSMMLSTIMSPSGPANNAAKDVWGMGMQEKFIGEDGKLIGGIENVIGSFLDLDEREWKIAQSDMFSQNASRLVVPFIQAIRDDPTRYREIVATIESGEFLSVGSAIANSTLGAQIQDVKNAWLELMTAFTYSIDGNIIGFLNTLSGGFREFADIINGVPQIGKIFAGLYTGIGVVLAVGGAFLSAAGMALVLQRAFLMASQGAGVLMTIMHAIPMVLGVGIPVLLALAAAIYAFKVAWDNNLGGLQDKVSGLQGLFSGDFSNKFFTALSSDKFENMYTWLVRVNRAAQEFVSGTLLGLGDTNNLNALMESMFGSRTGGAINDGLEALRSNLGDLRSGFAGLFTGVRSGIPSFLDFYDAALGVVDVLATGGMSGRGALGLRKLGDWLGIEDLDSQVSRMATRFNIAFKQMHLLFQIFTTALRSVFSEIRSNLDAIFTLENGFSVLGFAADVAKGAILGFGAVVAGAVFALAKLAAGITNAIANLDAIGGRINNVIESVFGFRVSLDTLGTVMGAVFGGLLAGRMIMAIGPIGTITKLVLGLAGHTAMLTARTAALAAQFIAIRVGTASYMALRASLLAVGASIGMLNKEATGLGGLFNNFAGGIGKIALRSLGFVGILGAVAVGIYGITAATKGFDEANGLAKEFFDGLDDGLRVLAGVGIMIGRYFANLADLFSFVPIVGNLVDSLFDLQSVAKALGATIGVLLVVGVAATLAKWTQSVVALVASLGRLRTSFIQTNLAATGGTTAGLAAFGPRMTANITAMGSAWTRTIDGMKSRWSNFTSGIFSGGMGSLMNRGLFVGLLTPFIDQINNAISSLLQMGGVGESVANTISKAFTGALMGAYMGAAFGPVGALVGAGIGAGYGIWSGNREEKKKREQEAQASRMTYLESALPSGFVLPESGIKTSNAYTGRGEISNEIMYIEGDLYGTGQEGKWALNKNTGMIQTVDNTSDLVYDPNQVAPNWGDAQRQAQQRDWEEWQGYWQSGQASGGGDTTNQPISTDTVNVNGVMMPRAWAENYANDYGSLGASEQQRYGSVEAYQQDRYGTDYINSQKSQLKAYQEQYGYVDPSLYQGNPELKSYVQNELFPEGYIDPRSGSAIKVPKSQQTKLDNQTKKDLQGGIVGTLIDSFFGTSDEFLSFFGLEDFDVQSASGNALSFSDVMSGSDKRAQRKKTKYDEVRMDFLPADLKIARDQWAQQASNYEEFQKFYGEMFGGQQNPIFQGMAESAWIAQGNARPQKPQEFEKYIAQYYDDADNMAELEFSQEDFEKFIEHQGEVMTSYYGTDTQTAMRGVFSPSARSTTGGVYRTVSGQEGLTKYADPLLEVLGEAMPWMDDPTELLVDAQLQGELGGNLVGTGNKMSDVYGDSIQQWSQESGVPVADIEAAMPQYYYEDQFVPQATVDFTQAIGSADQGFLGIADNALNMDWGNFKEYAINQSMGGNQDWDFFDFMAEERDITREQAREEAIVAGQNQGLTREQATVQADQGATQMGGSSFTDTVGAVNSMGGEIVALGVEWWDYFNQVTQNGTDKTIDITQEQFNALPDYVKMAYSNMGYQFVIGGQQNIVQAGAQADYFGNQMATKYGAAWQKIAASPADAYTVIRDETTGMVSFLNNETGNIDLVVPAAEYDAYLSSLEVLKAETARIMAETRDIIKNKIQELLDAGASAPLAYGGGAGAGANNIASEFLSGASLPAFDPSMMGLPTTAQMTSYSGELSTAFNEGFTVDVDVEQEIAPDEGWTVWGTNQGQEMGRALQASASVEIPRAMNSAMSTGFVGDTGSGGWETWATTQASSAGSALSSTLIPTITTLLSGLTNMAPAMPKIDADPSPFEEMYHLVIQNGADLAAKTFTSKLSADTTLFGVAVGVAQAQGWLFSMNTYTASLSADTSAFWSAIAGISGRTVGTVYINVVENRVGSGGGGTGGAFARGGRVGSAGRISHPFDRTAMGSRLVGRAKGGSVGGSEYTLVGERGPEIVKLPIGSYVYTARESENMMDNVRTSSFNTPIAAQLSGGGGTTNVTVNNQGSTVNFNGDIHITNKEANDAFWADYDRRMGNKNELARRGMTAFDDARPW